MKLLLISNSTNAGEEYLKYPIGQIKEHLAGIKEVAFVPYAGVTFSYDEYEAKVQARLDEIGIKVRSVHHASSPREAILSAEAIMVGGGNTFHLVKMMHEEGLMDAILTKLNEGTPYVGWSAGSNVACPTLCTTNDMPIVQHPDFHTFPGFADQDFLQFPEGFSVFHNKIFHEDKVLRLLQLGFQIPESILGFRVIPDLGIGIQWITRNIPQIPELVCHSRIFRCQHFQLIFCLRTVILMQTGPDCPQPFSHTGISQQFKQQIHGKAHDRQGHNQHHPGHLHSGIGMFAVQFQYHNHGQQVRDCRNSVRIGIQQLNPQENPYHLNQQRHSHKHKPQDTVFCFLLSLHRTSLLWKTV